MNRLFTFICIVSLLLFHTSCNEGVMELESSDVELKTRATEQKVHNLIQQARYGDLMLITHWNYAIVMAMVLTRIISTWFACMLIIARKQEMTLIR